MSYSSKKLPPLTLAIRFTAKAAELLSDFVNTHPEDFDRFEFKWSEHTNRGWYSGTGREAGAIGFLEAQQLVRELWEGNHKGNERQIVERGLSIDVARQEEGWWDSTQLLFHVDWDSGTIGASPRDLGDYVWLSLLQYSKQLAVCANKANECPAPYFIKKKPNQKFCSDVCALPAQREFKRQWFREHGDEWRKKWLKKKKKLAKKSQREK